MLKKRHMIYASIMMLIMITSVLVIAFNPMIDNWYDVEDWEVEVCSKWGGLADVQKHAGTITGDTALHKLAATIQGEKIRIGAGDEEKTVYEIAWYIQPVSGQEKFTVEVYGQSGKKEIEKGTAPATTGTSGYYVIDDTSSDYTNAVLKYDTGSIDVPIVERTW